MKESEIYFNFLTHVIAADGNVKIEETDYILKAMQEAGISATIQQKVASALNQVKAGQNLDTLEETIEGIGLCDNPFFILNLFKDSIGMATSDEHIDQREIDVIKKLVACFSSNPERDYPLMEDWALRMIAMEKEGLALLEKISSGDN